MKNRIVFAQRNTTLANYDSALIADFEARGWTVTTFANGAQLPLDAAYYDDVVLLVMGAYGTSLWSHASGYALAGLPVPILSLCRYTAYSNLGMAQYSASPTINAFYRRTVGDPRATFESVSLTSAAAQCIYTVTSGTTIDYYASYNYDYAGIARRTRTVGGVAYESLFWGYHNIQNLTGDALTLWRAYSGGTDTSPREVRATLASPLGAVKALVSVDAEGTYRGSYPLGRICARVLLGSAAMLRLDSPLGVISGVAVPAAAVQVLLPSPLVATLGAFIVPAPAALLQLLSPLGAMTALVAAETSLWLALASPLGALSASVRQPVPVVAPAVPVGARPRLLSDPLPLRASTDLPRYRADTLLPWVYGTVTLAPVPWDAAGLEWLLADHPIAAVHWVKVDGVEVDGWELVQTLDALSHPLALLRLTKPATAAPAVNLSGRMHPTSGAVIRHPADIADDLLRQCGWTTDPDAFRPVREAWPDVALGGVLDAAESLREAITRLFRSIGADWSAAPLRAWVPGAGPSLATLGAGQIDDGSASADHGTLATALRVTYAHDWAAGAPRGAMTVEAAEATAAFGRIEADLDLAWVRTAREALAVASVALRDLARPRWSISLNLAPGADWLPGDRLTLAHPWLPQGVATVVGATQDAASLTLALERLAGAAPTVALTGRGALSDAAANADLGVTYAEGVATFTVLDATGAPLAGASVTLDSITTRTTDRQGRVQFTTRRGNHSLTIVAAGYATMELEVTV